jgi:hypothetical protein
MAKALDEDVNEQLRTFARGLLKNGRFESQVALAKAMSVSPGFVSDFLSEKRGAGRELLVGLGRLAPLELLKILEIDPRVIVDLWGDGTGNGEIEMKAPDGLRRAARAAIELTGCTPADAHQAALVVLAEWGERADADADWWLTKLRKKLPERTESGVRPVLGT